MTRTLACLLLALAAACGAKTPPPAATQASSASDAGAATCTSNQECGPGEMCAGPEGCEVAWTCVPARPCTRDMVIFCGCDGQEHQGSGSCPPAPYRHRGPCGAK
jgi:hypothetical protein